MRESARDERHSPPEAMGTICLTAHELKLLAAAIEADAAAHDKQAGTGPFDLWDATQRAQQLRSLAEQLREGAR